MTVTKGFFFSAVYFLLISSTSLSAQNLYAAKSGSSFGYINEKGVWIIQPQFDWAAPFSCGFARVKEGLLSFYVNRSGKPITTNRFSKAYDFEGDIARVVTNESGVFQYGLIDTTGNWIVRPSFRGIHKFADNGLALAKDKKGDWGFINRQGTWIITPQYSHVHDFHEGLSATSVADGMWGYLDAQSNWVIKPIFYHTRNFSEGRAAVRTEDDFTYIDKQGNIIGKEIFDVAKDFSDSVGVARAHRKWGIVDYNGEWKEVENCDYLHRFKSGLAAARWKGLWGLVNREGKWVVPAVYSVIHDTGDDTLCVKDGYGKYGFINAKTGDFVVKPSFSKAEPFVDGFAIAKTNKGWGIIDRSGAFVVKPTFSSLKSPIAEEEADEENPED
jgi:hypothetical protein